MANAPARVVVVVAETHRLSEKNKAALKATCSVCGPGVDIKRNGKYGFVCIAGRRQANKRYRAAHPERVRQMKRRPPSEHRLVKRDGSPDECKVCGPVTPVVWGRGWCCPKRALELGRTEFPEAPAPRCSVCVSKFLDAAGECPECDSRENTDLGYALMLLEKRYRDNDVNPDFMAYLEEVDNPGFSVVSGETPLPESSESVVPGWKTIGSPVSSAVGWSVRPEYAALHGSGSR